MNTSREKIAKKYSEIYFAPSDVKYNPDTCEFESKYTGELHDKVCVSVNNGFEYFLRGWHEAIKEKK